MEGTPVDAEANALNSPLLLYSPLLLWKNKRVTIGKSSAKVAGPRA